MLSSTQKQARSLKYETSYENTFDHAQLLCIQYALNAYPQMMIYTKF